MRKNILLIVIIFLTVIAWHRILFQTFTGEGYYYFFKGDSNIFRYDIGASLLFDLLRPIFKDNFFPFQLLLLCSFTVIVILFYLIVYEMTQSKKISLISAILFGLNYNTVFEMIGTGAYQNFVQRVFFLLLLFSSFILFIKFINNKKIHYYLISLALAVLSTGLAYFSFFYIPFLMAFFLGFLFSRKIKFKEIIFLFSLTVIYILICLFIVNIPVIFKIPNMMPSESFFTFIFNNMSDIVINFFRQLTILSTPDIVLRQIFSILNISYSQAIYRNNGIQYLYLPVFLIYITAGIFLLKKERKLRVSVIASLLFLPFIFVLNLYTRTDHVSNLEPGSRYLFVPSVGYSIFWGIFLSHFLHSKIKTRIKLINQLPCNAVYLIIFVWVILQIVAINRQMQEQLPNNIATKKIISYFKNELSPKLKDDSIVITPYLMGNWGSWFLNMYYGKNNTVFTPRMTAQFEWKAEDKQRGLKRSFNPNKDFIIYYDETAQKVVNITKDYKSIIKNK